MMTVYLKMFSLLAIAIVTGIFGLIWLFGEHASIWVTVGVKPFALFMLFISYVVYGQLVREMRMINERDAKSNNNN